MDLISSLTSNAVNKALDGLSKRHMAIASNIANADTPGFKTRSVQFENALGQALQKARGQQNTQASNDAPLGMKSSSPRHFSLDAAPNNISDINPSIEEAEDLQYRNDGNGVDLEREMSQLARNTERYLALSNIKNRMGKTLRATITSSS